MVTCQSYGDEHYYEELGPPLWCDLDDVAPPALMDDEAELYARVERYAGKMQLHDDTAGVHGGSRSVQSLRGLVSIDETLNGGARGAGGEEGGWLW